MKARYTQRRDGEGFTVPSGKLYRIACCDCGLVHDFVFVAGRGVVGIAARRNKRATAGRRRWKANRRERLEGIEAVLVKKYGNLEDGLRIIGYDTNPSGNEK